MKTAIDLRTYIDSPIGSISLQFNSKLELTSAQFHNKEKVSADKNSVGIREIETAKKQFEEYFKGNRTQFTIIIPCHRVIGSDGSLTGYAGGLHRKKWLLEHENPVKQQSLF